MYVYSIQQRLRSALTALQRGWRLVGEALSGRQRDYTSSKIGRAVLLLAIPMVLEMEMESILAVVVFRRGRWKLNVV